MSYKTTFYIIKNRRYDVPYHFINLDEEVKKLECSVCLEYYNENTVKLYVCGHIYHEKCIRNSLKMSRLCPLCRTNVDEVNCGCEIL